MIVFGTRGLKSKVSTGSFYCPQCCQEKPQQWYKVRRWFTLYFIPLIPLTISGEYVECQTCLGTFDTDAVNHGPEHYDAADRAFQAEFQKAMLTTMVLMMLADGKVLQSEIDIITVLFKQLTGGECPTGLVNDEVTRLEGATASINDYLGSVSGRLNDGGKAMVFKSAVLVAQADGEVAKDEEQLLKQTYKALGLSRSEAKAIRSSLK